MSTFVLPDLGEGLHEAEIVSWHVAEGDRVVADQPLLSVETEKAVVEIPAPSGACITKCLVKVGDRVKVGTPLLEYEISGHRNSDTVVGELPGDSEDRTGAMGSAAAPIARVHAMPAVRARAAALGLDLASVVPRGPGGTITMADVEAAASTSRLAGHGEPLRGAMRTMAVNMARAWKEVVHATIQDYADVHAWGEEESINARLVHAIVSACEVEPSLNGAFDGNDLTLRLNSKVNVGIAMDSTDGLFVPVLTDAAKLTTSECATQIARLKECVRKRSLTLAEMTGATISLSNFGVIAGRHGFLIVMPPQVAIVGAGRLDHRAVQFSRDRVVPHRILPLSVTFDHRAVTGGAAARFLRAMIANLEMPSRKEL